jgi:tetratricopeptide (TPR) repeat protein
MNFSDVRLGETFTRADETPTWRVILKKTSAEAAVDDTGCEVEVDAEEAVDVVGGASLSHALWVQHEGDWKLVLRWQAVRERRPRWVSLDGGSSDGAKKAGALSDGDRRARALLAGALQARGDHEQALKVYDELLADVPDAALLNNRGAVRAALGGPKGAIADYTQAVALDPVLAQAWCNRGNALSKLGKNADALADYDRALTLTTGPDLAAVRCNRGLARKLCGDLEGSLADFDASLALDGRFAQAYLARGSVRAIRGDVPGAISDLERYLEVGPNAPQAAQVRVTLAKLQELAEANA